MSLAGIFFLLSGLLATISSSKGKKVKSPVMSVDLQVLDIVIIETRTDHTTGSMNWRSNIFPAFFTFKRHPLASIETSYLESNRFLCSRQNLSKLQPSCHGMGVAGNMIAQIAIRTVNHTSVLSSNI